MPKLTDKILVIFHSYRGSFAAWQDSGILERELLIYRSLRSQFKNIYFVSYGTNKEQEQQLLGDVGVALTNEKGVSPWLYALTAWWRHRHILRTCDVIKTNQMSSMLMALWVKLRYPSKKLVVRTGFQWSQFQKSSSIIKRFAVRLIERLACFFANVIIVTSEADKKYLIRSYRSARSRTITVIPAGIDTQQFIPGGKKNKKLIVSVGRLEQQKNYESLITALAGSNYHLEIYGSGSLHDKLAQLARERKTILELKGVVPNTVLPDMLNQAAVFVLPSLWEGSPKALLEAMACGLSVIVSDIESHQEIIQNRINGLIVSATTEALAVAIRELMDNAKLAAQLGKAARQTVVEFYGTQQTIIKEQAVYESLFAVHS